MAAAQQHRRLLSHHFISTPHLATILKNVMNPEQGLGYASRILNDAPIDPTMTSICENLLVKARAYVNVKVLIDGGSWQDNDRAFSEEFQLLFKEIDAAILQIIQHLHKEFLMPSGDSLQPWFQSELTAAANKADLVEWEQFLAKNYQEFIRQIHGAIFLHTAEIAAKFAQDSGLLASSEQAFIARMLVNRTAPISVYFDYSSSLNYESKISALSYLCCCFSSIAAPVTYIEYTKLSAFIKDALERQFDGDFERKVAVIDMARMTLDLLSPPSTTSTSTFNPIAAMSTPRSSVASLSIDVSSKPATLPILTRAGELEYWLRSPLADTDTGRAAIASLKRRQNTPAAPTKRSSLPPLSTTFHNPVHSVRPPSQSTRFTSDTSKHF